MAKSITKEELIEKLMAFVKEKGRPPRLTEFGNSSSINRHFGSYKEFILSQGLVPYRVEPKLLTREEMEQRLKSFIKSKGRTPTQQEFAHTRSIKKEYRNYLGFLKNTGYTLMHIRSQPTPTERHRTAGMMGIKITEEFLLEELAFFVKEYGQIPTAKEFGYSERQIKRYFGSYEKFLHCQGLALHKEEIAPLSKKKLVNKLKTFVLIQERLPTEEEFGYLDHVERLYGSFEAFTKENEYEPSLVEKE
ncbi:homing endonuclease associated repeat-containing protein [uncultured Enterococcus sp.]|uniref:homing endonuclease associated repeat-containing protein n=1 Tax=uncultured Enterococcus sp. TaxID=167972 RepID=UPI00258C6811|nr:hypothetical protein [uncultured Enterococcus sp.]